eukprot:3719399-Rhodomonas_salina.1
MARIVGQKKARALASVSACTCSSAVSDSTTGLTQRSMHAGSGDLVPVPAVRRQGRPAGDRLAVWSRVWC